MNTTYYIGLDVHSKSIAIAYTREGERKEAIYHGSCGGSNLSAVRALRQLAKKLGVDFKSLKVCYEAGPTGFVLARRLIQLGLECVVMSPSKTERKPNEKIKTDSRAERDRLPKGQPAGWQRRLPSTVTPRRSPSSSAMATSPRCASRPASMRRCAIPRPRDRARTDTTDDLSRAKQRLNSFLLRNGHRWGGGSRWTDAHMRYLRELSMPNAYQRVTLEEYIAAVDECIQRRERITKRLKEALADWEWAPVVRALMACKGFQEVAAMTLVAELGDLRRFNHPQKLMSFLGLVPGEESSGTTRRQGAITKCGNSHARWMLVECSLHYRRAPKISSALSKRQQGQSRQVKELAWRMQNRLHQRYVKLKARGKREQKAIIAIARELSAFLWELHNKIDLPIPAAPPAGK